MKTLHNHTTIWFIVLYLPKNQRMFSLSKRSITGFDKHSMVSVSNSKKFSKRNLTVVRPSSVKNQWNLPHPVTGDMSPAT